MQTFRGNILSKNLIYTGKVRHRRFTPKSHEFSYRLFMFCFDISNIETAFNNIPQVSTEKFNWFSFYRKNYLKNPDLSLDQAVRELLRENYNIYPTGKIYLLTQLACLGYCFNPISLYLVFKENSNELQFVIAEVTNTPWSEKHLYVLSNPVKSRSHVYHFHFNKKLHVSPFMAMGYRYQLNIKLDDNHIIVHMNSYYDEECHFDATLTLKATSSTTKTFWRFPLIAYKVITAIYWQAFKLWIKGVPYHPHPKK
jgi:DUF1365 family protein